MHIMSELTVCNRCILNKLIAEATKQRLRVTIKVDRDYSLGGHNVYVHPKYVSPCLLDRGLPDHDRFFHAWFQEITPNCVC